MAKKINHLRYQIVLRNGSTTRRLPLANTFWPTLWERISCPLIWCARETGVKVISLVVVCSGKTKQISYLNKRVNKKMSIDLHSLHVEEAKSILQDFILPVLPVLKKVNLITSRGKHSDTGKGSWFLLFWTAFIRSKISAAALRRDWRNFALRSSICLHTRVYRFDPISIPARFSLSRSITPSKERTGLRAVW